MNLYTDAYLARQIEGYPAGTSVLILDAYPHGGYLVETYPDDGRTITVDGESVPIPYDILSVRADDLTLSPPLLSILLRESLHRLTI